jgi:hypothetical protein
MFRVVKSAVDPVSRNVALMIDSNPNGPTGFVRVATDTLFGDQGGPIVGSDSNIELGGGWWYREED